MDVTSAYVQIFRRLLKQNFFGEIYHVRCGWERSSGIPGIGRWFTDYAQSGGGALIDPGVHYLDLAMYVMGWPEPMQVSGALSNNFLQEGARIRRGIPQCRRSGQCGGCRKRHCDHAQRSDAGILLQLGVQY